MHTHTSYAFSHQLCILTGLLSVSLWSLAPLSLSSPVSSSSSPPSTGATPSKPKSLRKNRSEPDNVWASTYFTPVTCFLLFNCGDYVGRILAGWVRWPGKVSPDKKGILPISASFAGQGGAEHNFAVEPDKDRICSPFHALQRCA